MKKRWLPRLGERPFEHRRGALQASKRPVTWLKGMTSARRQKNIALILARQFAGTLAMPMFIADGEGRVVFYNEPAGRL